MIPRSFAAASFLAAALCVLSANAAETQDYVIQRYALSIEAQTGSPDARVTMEITYKIHSGKKSTGFKYIGTYEARDLRGRDGEGNTLRTWVDCPRETRINWAFTPAGPGEKAIVVTFTIPGALRGSTDSNTLDAPWAGIFKVPVNQAVYRLVLPDDAERRITTNFANPRIVNESGRRRIEFSQFPLRQTAFQVSFSPGIAYSVESSATGPVGARPAQAHGKPEKRPGGSGNAAVVVIFIIVVGVLAAIIARAKRARSGGHGAGRDSGSGGWSSSCAGGSSCGGGGCGGGGCGG